MLDDTNRGYPKKNIAIPFPYCWLNQQYLGIISSTWLRPANCQMARLAQSLETSSANIFRCQKMIMIQGYHHRLNHNIIGYHHRLNHRWSEQKSIGPETFVKTCASHPQIIRWSYFIISTSQPPNTRVTFEIRGPENHRIPCHSHGQSTTVDIWHFWLGEVRRYPGYPHPRFTHLTQTSIATCASFFPALIRVAVHGIMPTGDEFGNGQLRPRSSVV